MRIETYDTSQVQKMYVGPYYGRHFLKDTLPQLQAVSDKPVICNRLRTILMSQGFNSVPARDNRSVYDPRELFPCLERYGRWFSKQSIDKNALDKAIRMTFDAFAKPETHEYLEPWSLSEVTQRLHLSHSAGAPNFVKKGLALDSDLARAHRIVERKTKIPPCIAFHRIQQGDKRPKVRMVWGYPQSMSIVEGQFAIPLIDQFLWSHSAMAFGMNKMELGARLVPIKNQGYIYGFDVSKFDSSIQPFLIRTAFSILKTWFEPNYSKEWDLIENYFIYTPIIMPDGNVYKKTKGVPSGSWFTQLLDSIVNFLMIQYCLIRVRGRGVRKDLIMVLGDDSIFGLPRRIDVKGFLQAAQELGFVLSIEKSCFAKLGQPIHFLGRDWIMGLAHRSLCELLLRAVFPEKTSDDISDGLERMMAYCGDSLEFWQALTIVLVTLRIHATDFDIRSLFSRLPLGQSSGYAKFQEEYLPKQRFIRTVWNQLYLSLLLS